jgi:hypothetical protein
VLYSGRENSCIWEFSEGIHSESARTQEATIVSPESLELLLHLSVVFAVLQVSIYWESDAYLVVVAVFKTAAPTHCAGG